MLDITNLSVSYDGSQILRGVSLHAPASKVVCLMGRNGVGKSTTLKATVGLVKADQGVIKLDGEVISRMRPDVRGRKGLGYVPQGRDIFPHLTVRENLKIGLVAHGRKANGNMDRVFELFPVLKEMLDRKGGVLSGGQQQQLAIARAVLTEPKVLILDEPTEGIQPNIIDQIGDTIKLLREEGKMTILLVEQYLDFAQELADIFYIMDRGRIVAEGPIAELTDAVVKTHLMV
jgi:urea transport system ATP-binding protein